MRWNAIKSDFVLKENGWMANRFDIRKSWIPNTLCMYLLQESSEQL
jgi:hypothetical protein